MEEEKRILEKVEEGTKAKQNNKGEKKKITIMGCSLWELLAYFILYSFLGFLVETLFGLVTKGVLESRKSFLYGPFCGIYGLGAMVMIPALKKFNRSNMTLFWGGFFIGSIVEYVISLLGEMLFHIKWWDYSDMAFNLGGRICIAFSFFWGILSIFLMTYIHPKVEHFISKIPKPYFKGIIVVGILFLFVNACITAFALKMFFTRLTQNYELAIPNVEQYAQECVQLYENPTIHKLTDRFFSDEKMLKTFPNIKLTDRQGNIVHIKDLLKQIQPYYLKVFTPR